MTQHNGPEATHATPTFATDDKEIFTPTGKKIKLGDAIYEYISDGTFRVVGAVIKDTQDDHFRRDPDTNEELDQLKAELAFFKQEISEEISALHDKLDRLLREIKPREGWDG